MRFIVDESTGAAVANCLRSLGHDVLVVADAMPQADDQDILNRAMGETRVLITNDKDFGELVFRARKAHVGVVLLRLRDQSVVNRVDTVKFLLETLGDRIEGSFIVATDHGARIRYATISPDD
jgi:predicted nuclease of predicted toxin-antitoxin system